jgi:RNA polymerase sigma factor (sigma-70 family)
MMRADVTAAASGDHDAGIRLLGDLRSRRRIPVRLLRLASDERLVEHIRAGSEAAFEALFDRHHRGVLGFCRHMLGSVEEAEDAVQHTFLAAYRQLVGSDKQVLLRPWLYTIARNRCLTMLRGRQRQATGELHEPPTEHLASEVERRHELRDLLRDVAGLPEEQRSALVLSEVGDMSHDDIADVLGCRREKVKALVFQARSSLIASRAARDTPCAEIREQLANLRGGSLRRNELRRHVSECAGCREFREELRVQRRDLALVLPVAPTVGLKSAVVGAALGGSAGAPAAAGVAGGLAAAGGGAASGVAAKVLVVAAIAGGGTVAVRAETSGGERPAAPATTPMRAPASSAPAPVQPRQSSAAPAAADRGATTTTPARGRREHSPPAHAKFRGKRPKATAPGRARTKPAHPKHPAHPAKRAKPDRPTQAATPVKPAKLDRPAANPYKAPKPAAAVKPGKAATPLKPLKPVKPETPAHASPPEAVSAPELPAPAAVPKHGKPETS